MKVVTRYWLSAASIVTAAMVAACSGNNSGVTPSAPTGTGFNTATSSQATGDAKHNKRGKARLIIQIPRRPLSLTPLPLGKVRHTYPKYVSPSTQSMAVSIAGFPTQTFNLIPTSPNCATDPTNGYLTCQESMSGPTGQQTLTVTLYDQTNGQGNELATATTSVDIAQQGFTNVPITLGGIVATAAVLINGTTMASVPIGTPTNLPVTVEAYDADGNLIIPPGNYSSPITLSNSDQSGITSFTAPSTLTLLHRTKIATAALAAEALASMSHPTQDSAKERKFKPLDTTTIDTPGTTDTLYYNGDPLPAATTITASVSGTPQANGAATLTATGTVFTSYDDPTGSGGGGPQNITVGSDGALWFSDYHDVSRITTGGDITQYSIPGISGNGTRYITAGPDDALWFTVPSGEIGRITTSGTITSYQTSSLNLAGITTGPDGALWFADDWCGGIGRITTAGKLTEYFPSSSSYTDAQQIVTGPDEELWFTDDCTGAIGRITTAGTFPGEYQISSSNTQPAGITVGPDGALWFIESNPTNIGRITATGSITQYSYPVGYSSTPSITAGPDGALWFGERYNSTSFIGRISTAGVVTTYALPAGDASVSGVTVGPDGALWFTECAASKVDRMLIGRTP